MSVSYVDPLWTTRCLVVSTGRAATHTATHAATLTARPESKAKAKAKTTLYVTVHSVGRVVESRGTTASVERVDSRASGDKIHSLLFRLSRALSSLLFSSLLVRSPFGSWRKCKFSRGKFPAGNVFFLSFFFLRKSVWSWHSLAHKPKPRQRLDTHITLTVKWSYL